MIRESYTIYYTPSQLQSKCHGMMYEHITDDVCLFLLGLTFWVTRCRDGLTLPYYEIEHAMDSKQNLGSFSFLR